MNYLQWCIQNGKCDTPKLKELKELHDKRVRAQRELEELREKNLDKRIKLQRKRREAESKNSIFSLALDACVCIIKDSLILGFIGRHLRPAPNKKHQSDY